MRGVNVDAPKLLSYNVVQEVGEVNTIGKRLKYIRKLRGYSQGELADISLVARAVISNIEIDRYSTQMVSYAAIAKALNINLDWLLKGIGPMEIDNERAKILDELYHTCATLTESQQKYILETIRLMREHLIEE